MKEKEIMVQCSFCGKDIPCPENMKGHEKHMCFGCFNKPVGDDIDFDKVHVAVPYDKMNEMVLPEIMKNVSEKVFPSMWRERKSILKGLPRKELAREAFLDGAYYMFHSMTNSIGDLEKVKRGK